MAKSIKPIICPSCGSNRKDEVKPDFFLCQNCKTEYFLDRDEIIIYHKNAPNQPPENKSKVNIQPKIFAILLITIGLVFYILTTALFDKENKSSSTDKKTEQTEKLDRKDLRNIEKTAFETTDGKVYFLTIGMYQFRHSQDKPAEIHAFFTDEKGNTVKEFKLNISVPAFYESIPFELKQLDNNDQYFIFNKTRLLKIIPSKLDIRDVTDELSQIDEFSSGIAMIKGEFRQSGFKIMTVDGKTFIYMPLINRVIKAEEFRSITEQPIPKPTVKTFFSEAVADDAESEYSVLVKYLSDYKAGYPLGIAWFDYYEKTGVKLRHPDKHFIKAERFMSERIFFDLEVLFYNEKVLLIQYKLTPVDKNNFIQAIDIESEKVLWTFDCRVLGRSYVFAAERALYTEKYTLLIPTTADTVTLDSKTGELINQSYIY